MSEKLDFYEVNIDYVKYLKQFDSRIPDVVYQNRNKFVCGTLFKINGLNFFAPVSSFNIKQNSNYVIEVGNVPVGSVRYSFMFPVPDTEYLEKELRPVLLQMQFGETEVPNVKYEPIKKSLEEFLGEKDLQLATEDTYKSMSETSKSFEEIEQDEFNHDDIEI